MIVKQDIDEKPYMLSSGKVITGTLIWYANICDREVWLMAREITPDEDDAPLDMGRATHETYYRRLRKELALDGIRIDAVKLRQKVVCEVKTSSRYLSAAKLQLAYYLYRLKEFGITTHGELLIPRERKRLIIHLTNDLEAKLQATFTRIKQILKCSTPPSPTRKPYCRRCSYRDLCWI